MRRIASRADYLIGRPRLWPGEGFSARPGLWSWARAVAAECRDDPSGLSLREGPQLVSRTFSGDDGRLHVRAGAPPGTSTTAVVLVHGVIVSSRYLMPLGVELARDRAVLIPDLPGYGLSDKRASPPTIADLAEWPCSALRRAMWGISVRVSRDVSRSWDVGTPRRARLPQPISDVTAVNHSRRRSRADRYAPRPGSGSGIGQPDSGLSVNASSATSRSLESLPNVRYPSDGDVALQRGFTPAAAASETAFSLARAFAVRLRPIRVPPSEKRSRWDDLRGRFAAGRRFRKQSAVGPGLRDALGARKDWRRAPSALFWGGGRSHPRLTFGSTPEYADMRMSKRPARALATNWRRSASRERLKPPDREAAASPTVPQASRASRTSTSSVGIPDHRMSPPPSSSMSSGSTRTR